MSKPVCVIRVNEANVFEKALVQSGLSERFEVHAYAPNENIPDDVAARTESVAELFAENAQRFIDGKPLKAVVDRAPGY